MNLPSFKFEQQLWNKGLQFVAGADEVGRGCFAGPVVAATVAFAPFSCCDFPFSIEDKEVIINDSKKLSAKKRKVSDIWIRENALAWGIGSASVTEINSLGIGKATNRAFRRAVRDLEKKLKSRIEFLLVDAFYIPNTAGLPIDRRKKDASDIFNSNYRQFAIKKGDEKSMSIAASSIVAKVHRDRLMQQLGEIKRFRKFGWINNKGYGSSQHRNAIIEHGITSHHRVQFINTFLQNRELSF